MEARLISGGLGGHISEAVRCCTVKAPPRSQIYILNLTSLRHAPTVMREQVLKTSIEALKTSHHYIVVTEEKRAANTKGKLKATEQDEEREAEIERKLVQLQVAESELRKELEQSTPDEGVDLAGQSKSGRPPSYASSDQYPALTAAMPAFRDGEPIYNPFTGSYAYRETGFEPGPSEPNRASKGQHDAWILDHRSEDDIDNGAKAAANFPNGAMAETSPGQLSEDEATAMRQGSDIGTRDGDADRVGKRMFGNIVKFFESWTTLTVQRFFFGEKHSASESSASYTEEEKEDSRNQQRQDNEWNLGRQHERQLEQSSSQEMDSVLSPEEENRAKRDQTDVSRKLAIDLQTQQDEDETRRQAAFVVEQDRMEAMRLQKAFELEDERERQTLNFVRGLEEAMRLEEQEAILQEQRQDAIRFAQDLEEALRLQELEVNLQAQLQLAVGFAQDLEEAERLNQEFRALEEIKLADREYAQQLRNELSMQHDRFSAQEFEADIGNQTAFEHPVSSPLDEPLIPGLGNIQQMPGTFTHRPRSPIIPASRHPTKQTIPPMPFQKFQSFREEQRPTPNLVRQDYPFGPYSFRSQKTWTQALKDRLYAQKLFEAEKTRLANEEDQQRKDFNAWQKASEAADRPHNNAGTLVAEQEAMRNTEGDRVKKGRAPDSGSAQAAQQLRTVHAAQVASAIDSADCSICGDSLPKTQLVRPCDHYYCRACLAGQCLFLSHMLCDANQYISFVTDWFQRALREKPKKRPRCCKRDLPVNLVAHQLGPIFSQAYRMFELELMTPNPLYCSSRKCAAFVPPSNIHGDVGVCRCGGRTCRHCRSQEHRDKLCAQDKETQKVEELGKRKGWKHCPKCQHMIERTAGCLHMTCSQCRTEFCWKCLETGCRGEGYCRRPWR